jgi:hypothetical protein
MLFHSFGITLIALSIAAGLVSFTVAAFVALVLKKWRQANPRLENADTNGGDKRHWTTVLRSRYVLLAFPFGFALGLYLILDLGVSVSVYLRFTAIYAAFWILVFLLLLEGAPTCHKLLILMLLAATFFSVRFVDWNSRKPFLKDLYRIKKGMTVAQVEQIMGDYMMRSAPTVADEQGEIITGKLFYRHTDEGWGNCDVGSVFFSDSHVVYTGFSPD